MLRLRNRLLSAVRAAASPSPSLHRGYRRLLLSTAAAPAARFVAEDFLVRTCGLAPAEALRSAKYLAHLRSPSQPEAALAFLEGLGLAKAAVAAAVAREPRLLCCRVDGTLALRVAQLRGLGLSPPQISGLVAAAPSVLRWSGMVARVAFHLSVLGSYEKLHAALLRRRGVSLLHQDVERVVKPNMAFLKQCGLGDSDIANLIFHAPIVASSPEHVKQIVASADRLGIPRDSKMFKHALVTVYHVTPCKVDAKLDFMKKVLGCSEDELRLAVCKVPTILVLTEDNIRQTVDFLKTEVGLEAEYIVRRPILLRHSTKRRLIPRHYVIKVLKAKGMKKKEFDFRTAISLSEKIFAEKFLVPYKESVPGLVDAYAALCAGQVALKL
ncbi:hypothetical protein ACP4OV_000297 [Aristida adscensionis]